MDVRIGIDLVDVAEIHDALERWGERYLARVFTPSEITACGVVTDRRRPERLAACVAAKEAAFKVLPTARDGLPWKDVELTSRGSSEWSLRLSGAAVECAEREGVASLSVSIACLQDHAAAVVLAEIRRPNSTTNSLEA